ncbi:MAG: hypothetical protein K2G36_07760 [Ruminococcus sp.]|nr:hypothetical protein [Ruminococcus sp.]
MKKNLIKTLLGAVTVAGLLTCSVSAYATTVDDVAEAARQLGCPEETIQQAYAQYYEHPEDYDSNSFDYAIVYLQENKDSIFTTGLQNQNPVTTTTTTADVTTTSPVSDNTNNDNSTIGAVTENNSNNNDIQPTTSGSITLQTPDGEEFTRIKPQEFIDMSYDDKMDYVRNFTPEQQQVILDNLTIPERKSIMKQLPVEQKAEVVNSMVSFGETFDINVSVEEISENNISLSMRNGEGELIGMMNAGELVEDTGYDRRGILLLSAGLISFAGVLAGIVSKLFRTGDEK